MDREELTGVLLAILTGVLQVDNAPDDALASLRVLQTICANCKNNPGVAKFRRLPAATNEKLKQRVVNTPGASEFLDAVGFARLGENGDFVLGPDESRIDAALDALAVVFASLPPNQMAPQPNPTNPANPGPKKASPSPTPAASSSSDAEYEQRKREADLRQQEIVRKRKEEERKKEVLKAQIRAEQKDVRDRPVVASHAQHIVRHDASSAGAGGKPRFCNSDKEFNDVVNSKPLVLANFTASWCGPCQMIAPAVEELASKTPGVVFIKVDIDENQETPGRFGVSAVPTFILFRNGQNIGEVRGANLDGIKGLLAKAV